MPRSVSQSEFARRTGVHPSVVSEAADAGIITRGADGKVELEAGLAQLADNTDEVAVNARKGPTPGSYADSRRLREKFQAKIKRLEYEEIRGRLVRLDAVKAAWFRISRRSRDLLLAIPDRLSPVLAAESDPVEIHRLVTEELRHTATQMGMDPQYRQRPVRRGRGRPKRDP